MTMYVITHKHFNYKRLPHDYYPILVGANNNPNPDGFLQDNVGDNISGKNKSYCELTGLYWIWKHGTSDEVGLSHYRRYFANFEDRKKMYMHELIYGKVKAIDVNVLSNYLKDGYDWVASQLEYGGPGTLWEQFDRNHNIRDLEALENIIKVKYPEYYGVFESVMKENNVGSFYNMFYTNRYLLNEYCSWLFEVLSCVEKRTNISEYNNYQQRLYGFLGERLMNVWLRKNKVKVKYLPVFQTNEVSRMHVLKLIKERIIY